jgi:hypothetical protein
VIAKYWIGPSGGTAGEFGAAVFEIAYSVMIGTGTNKGLDILGNVKDYIQACSDFSRGPNQSILATAPALVIDGRPRKAPLIGDSRSIDAANHRCYRGIQYGTIREYSDTLLIFLLKANNPEKFGDCLSSRERRGVAEPMNVLNPQQVVLHYEERRRRSCPTPENF